jgi:hypothetical protein
MTRQLAITAILALLLLPVALVAAEDTKQVVLKVGGLT